MKTKAAVLWNVGDPWSVEEVDLDPPKAGEVLIRVVAAGLCHSDDHLATGDMPSVLPMVAGHEGAGIVEEVGPNVTRVRPGDHVVVMFMPSCGHCRWCATGRTNLCDLGGSLMMGVGVDGTSRLHARGKDVTTMCFLGTFSQYAVLHEASVIRIDDDLPMDAAALVACGVPTGFGSAVHTAGVRPGEAVVVVGAGGVGMNAIQGARIAGAELIIAVDPVEFKRDQAKVFGATHTSPSMAQATELVRELTRGVMADAAILTVGVAHGDQIAPLLGLVSKGGRAIVTAVAPAVETEVTLSLFDLTIFQKELRGTLFGASNGQADIPRLLSLYRSGQLKLDELITNRYTLDEINTGYDDMRAGRNIRGVILHGH
ncbi:alcohol dehydrogenase [Frankia sp. CcI49]|uniref:NDMA-dependent alcohol dehydrogenase n=1 Tax=Frankia sp. CcI49 TaxID=1745382 RepID=UPI000976706F|nr:NDMA-dependent alcohol dehydrogenase [Frankia sp. CcI49]ONH62045.1 alcohol dehydrogenase [Frankia sp. CcI49]